MLSLEIDESNIKAQSGNFSVARAPSPAWFGQTKVKSRGRGRPRHTSLLMQLWTFASGNCERCSLVDTAEARVALTPWRAALVCADNGAQFL